MMEAWLHGEKMLNKESGATDSHFLNFPFLENYSYTNRRQWLYSVSAERWAVSCRQQHTKERVFKKKKKNPDRLTHRNLWTRSKLRLLPPHNCHIQFHFTYNNNLLHVIKSAQSTDHVPVNVQVMAEISSSRKTMNNKLLLSSFEIPGCWLLWPRCWYK